MMDINVPQCCEDKDLVLAVSGGVDSMVLCHLLVPLWHQAFPARSVIIYHCNYGLRGEASDLDEQLVRQVADSLGVTVEVQHAGRAPGSGVQHWAREIRQAAFRKHIQRGRVAALGHHRDDQEETILFQMLRRQGMLFCGGMKPFDRGLWRPLLPYPKVRLREWARGNNVPSREDASNAKLIYSRNFIRNRILPRLKHLEATGDELLALGRSSEALRSSAERLASLAKERLPGVWIRNLPEEVWPDLIRLYVESKLGPVRGAKVYSRAARRFAECSGEPQRFQLTREHDLSVSTQGVEIRGRYNAKGSLRFAQHRAAMEREAYEIFLGPGASLKQVGDMTVDYESKVGGVSIKVATLRPSERIRFGNAGKSWQYKELIRLWHGSSQQSPLYKRLCVGGETIGLFDGADLITPGPDGRPRVSRKWKALMRCSDKDKIIHTESNTDSLA